MRTGAGLLTGHPVPSIQLRIVPDQWGQPIAPLTSSELDALALPPGEPGEIVVSGPHVLTGYLHGQGDEETKFDVDGRRWHRTGDAGYLDAGGRLWLLGRCSARIDDGRGRVYPFAVECALDGIAGVKRTAFLAHGGRRLLVAELEPGASPRQTDARRCAPPAPGRIPTTSASSIACPWTPGTTRRSTIPHCENCSVEILACRYAAMRFASRNADGRECPLPATPDPPRTAPRGVCRHPPRRLWSSAFQLTDRQTVKLCRSRPVRPDVDPPNTSSVAATLAGASSKTAENPVRNR